MPKSSTIATRRRRRPTAAGETIRRRRLFNLEEKSSRRFSADARGGIALCNSWLIIRRAARGSPTARRQSVNRRRGLFEGWPSHASVLRYARRPHPPTDAAVEGGDGAAGTARWSGASRQSSLSFTARCRRHHSDPCLGPSAFHAGEFGDACEKREGAPMTGLPGSILLAGRRSVWTRWEVQLATNRAKQRAAFCPSIAEETSAHALHVASGRTSFPPRLSMFLGQPTGRAVARTIDALVGWRAGRAGRAVRQGPRNTRLFVPQLATEARGRAPAASRRIGEPV
jgi:hypothetical protein